MKIRKNGKVINLTESDLRKITKYFLSEQDGNGEPAGGGLKITNGYTFDNGLTINDREIEFHDRGGGIVWFPTQGNAGNEFSCKRHEMGKYFLFPTGNGKNTLTKEESEAIYNQYCKKEGEPAGGGLKITNGYTFDNGLTINDDFEIEFQERQGGIVFLPTQGNAGNEFSCKRHEMGKYILFPTGNGKYTLTKQESQALYDQYCRK